MAKRSKRIRRKAPRRQASPVKKGLIILRKKGLIGKDEFKGKKPTKGARNVVKKYADVIEGRSTVVKPSTRLIPSRLRKQGRERRGRLVVPKTRGTVSTRVKRIRVSGNRKLKIKPHYRTVIERTRRVRGKLTHEIVNISVETIQPLTEGKVYRVSIKNGNGHEWSTHIATEEALKDFLERYDTAREWFDISIVDLPDSFK